MKPESTTLGRRTPRGGFASTTVRFKRNPAQAAIAVPAPLLGPPCRGMRHNVMQGLRGKRIA
jgi:hypothetical protein